MHEFQDLKDYYDGYLEQQRQPCQQITEEITCKSDSYNLAIIGGPHGKYSESHVTIWRICHRNNHVRRLDDIYIPHLHAHLGFDYDIDHDEDGGPICDVDDMYRSYKNERYFIKELSEFLDGQNYKYKIHAVGMMAELNSNEHLEWDEPLEHSIKMIWRETYHRKVIPSELFEDDDTDEIFSWHVA